MDNFEKMMSSSGGLQGSRQISPVKRPVGRPRKVPRTREEEEEFKRKQKKALAQKLAKWEMKPLSSDEDFLNEDDDMDEFDELDEEDSDTSIMEMLKQSAKAKFSNASFGKYKTPMSTKQTGPTRLNKSLMCKPIMMTKATSCNPIRVGKITQTEYGNPDEKKIFMPVPFPLLTPAPVLFNVAATPYPLPTPTPLTIPYVTPFNKEAIENALKQLQDIHGNLPEDENEKGTGDDDLKLSNILKQLQLELTVESDKMECITKDVQTEDAEVGKDKEPVDGTDGEKQVEDKILNDMMETEKEEGDDKSKVLKAANNDTSLADTTKSNDSIGESVTMTLNHVTEESKDESSKHEIRSIQDKEHALYLLKQTLIPLMPVRKMPINDSQMRLKYSYGINAYRQWVTKKNAEMESQWRTSCKKSSFTNGGLIYKPIKKELLRCTPNELSMYLTMFVREVIKPTGESYACDSVFYFCLGIQHYLFENGRIDDIFHNKTYKSFIDELYKKLTGFQIKLSSQGLMICRITEEHLWESRYLGSFSPYSLIDTLVYLNTKNFLLTNIEAHLGLSFSNVMKQWKKNAVSTDGKPARTVYLKYNPISTLQAAVEKKNKIDPNLPYEQLENVENPLRCPVKLYEFYLSKCPESIKHRNDLFYLLPEPSCVPESPVWFSANPIDHADLAIMINRVKVVREVQESMMILNSSVSVLTSGNTTQDATNQAFYRQ